MGLQALYKAAYSHEVKRDIYAECQNQFAQHMLEVHGENMEAMLPNGCGVDEPFYHKLPLFIISLDPIT